MNQGSGYIDIFSFSNNGEYFASGGSQDVYVWNFKKRISYGPFRHLSSIHQIEFIEDDKFLTVIDGDGNVYIWDYLKGSKNDNVLSKT